MVNHKLVSTGIVQPFDATSKELLTDGAKTIASRVTTMCKAGISGAEIQAVITGVVSGYIRRMKAESRRVVRDG